MRTELGCLTDEELEKYALSELGFFAQLRAEAHLSHCPDCREAFRTIIEEVA